MSNQQARQFLENFACDELAEIELGQIALGQADTEVVRTFAARMIKLHRELNDEIHRLDRRLTLHLEIHLDSHRLTTVADLAATRGRFFDERYMAHEVDWLERTLATVRHLGPADNDEVLLYLARQMELLEANLHLAWQARAVLETPDIGRAPRGPAGSGHEGVMMKTQDNDQDIRKSMNGGTRDTAAPSPGAPLDKEAAPSKAASPAKPETERLAGKGTGMDTDSSQGSNLGL